jgi:hypothetical protein
MVEVSAREIAKLQLEIQNLQQQLQDRPVAMAKDLSLVSLVPKSTGTSRLISVQEFFDMVESVAVMG